MAELYKYGRTDQYYAGEIKNTYGLTFDGAAPVKPEVIPGHWPKWNGKTWEQVEDHRKRAAGGHDVPIPAQEATEYWLPGDTYETPARTMVGIGPLPKDALLKRPEPPEAILCAWRIAEIKGELQAIDAAKVRPMSAIIDGAAADDEKVRLAELNAQADQLRAELQMLEVFIPAAEGDNEL